MQGGRFGGSKPVMAVLGTMRQVSRFHGMSEQAEACRRKAAECERAAVLATRPDMQAIYRDLARQWHRMAEHSEDLERRQSNSRAAGFAFWAPSSSWVLFNRSFRNQIIGSGSGRSDRREALQEDRPWQSHPLTQP